MEIEWAVAAALIGALATFSVWVYASRRRLFVRAAELDKSLELRTTELESVRLQLQRLSTEDPLTAVANHEQFLEFLEREWRRARRDGLPVHAGKAWRSLHRLQCQQGEHQGGGQGGVA